MSYPEHVTAEEIGQWITFYEGIERIFRQLDAYCGDDMARYLRRDDVAAHLNHLRQELAQRRAGNARTTT